MRKELIFLGIETSCDETAIKLEQYKKINDALDDKDGGGPKKK